MNLTNLNLIMPLLKSHGFNFSKGLGQNFLIDESVCPKMAELCGADKNYGVLEIGPGVGVLTKELSKVAKKIVAIEIDSRLLPVLDITLNDCKNVKIIEGDVLKLDLKELIKTEFGDMPVVVCANLPYYITSPIVMALLEQKLDIESITVMVQKETAERFSAPVGSRMSGAVTVSINYYAKVNPLFEVKKEAFMQSPKVDSEVIKLDVLKNPPIKVLDEKVFFRVVKSAFSQRRKTVYNSLSSMMGMPKEEIGRLLDECEIERTARAENLTLQNFADMANKIKERD
jgi:16S rRNA (adenine1518-N6/adenine1519-N6)-dimethyltransferase